MSVTNDSYRTVMSRRRWRRLTGELRARGGGVKESGAFLLGRAGHGRNVRAVAYYDDLDANCLTGGISFSGSGYSQLWEMCRRQGLTVVADVHTHPGDRVGQSDIDATNPMIAQRGHVAVIVPRYAAAAAVDDCGVHIYEGGGRWQSLYGADASKVLQVRQLVSPVDGADLTVWARAVLARVRWWR